MNQSATAGNQQQQRRQEQQGNQQQEGRQQQQETINSRDANNPHKVTHGWCSQLVTSLYLQRYARDTSEETAWVTGTIYHM